MVCAPVRSIIPSLKLGDYLSVQAHKPCSISHLKKLKAGRRRVLLIMQIFVPLNIAYRVYKYICEDRRIQGAAFAWSYLPIIITTNIPAIPPMINII